MLEPCAPSVKLGVVPHGIMDGIEHGRQLLQALDVIDQDKFSGQAIDEPDAAFDDQLLDELHQTRGAEPEGEFVQLGDRIIHPGDAIAIQVIEVVLHVVVLGDDDGMVTRLPQGVDDGAGIGPHSCRIFGGDEQYVLLRVSHEG